MTLDSTQTPSGPPQRTSERRSPRARGHGSKTPAVRERAVLALLSERTIGLAAKRAGIGERTLREWLTDDGEFQEHLAAARRAVFEAGINRVQALTGRAVETLEDLLEAKRHPAMRLGAARTLLELGVNRHDADTLLRKLADIELRQEQWQDRRGKRS